MGVIFLDFQQAFDCVSHHLPPPKLQVSGIYNNVLNWILDYLCNRNQYVSIRNGRNSTIMKIPSGAPQGFLLGTRLFTIFTNDLPRCLDSSISSKIEMFADDCTILIRSQTFTNDLPRCLDSSILACVADGIVGARSKVFWRRSRQERAAKPREIPPARELGFYECRPLLSPH